MKKPADFDELHGFDPTLNDKCVKGYNPTPDLGAADYCECNVGDDDVCQTCKSRTCNCVPVPTGLPAGAEAGIAIGACAIIGFIFAVCYFIRRRRTGGQMSDGEASGL